jgi:hypothetical protein
VRLGVPVAVCEDVPVGVCVRDDVGVAVSVAVEDADAALLALASAEDDATGLVDAKLLGVARLLEEARDVGLGTAEILDKGVKVATELWLARALWLSAAVAEGLAERVVWAEEDATVEAVASADGDATVETVAAVEGDGTALTLETDD